jgi:hypothetical protein
LGLKKAKKKKEKKKTLTKLFILHPLEAFPIPIINPPKKKTL